MRAVTTIHRLLRLGVWTFLIAACGSPKPEDPQAAAWQRHHQTGTETFQQGRYADAEIAWEQALDLARRFPEHDLRLHRTLDDLARLSVVVARLARAESLYAELLDLQQRTDPHGRGVLATLGRMADVYRKQKEPARAESLYVHLLALQENGDPRNPDIPSILGKLADLQGEQGHFLAADSLATRAMALKFHHQGYVHFVGRRNREAEAFYRRALDIQERKLGSYHPDLARTCYDLGLLYELREDFAQAETFYRRALDIQEENTHPDLPRTLDQLAGLLDETDRSLEAQTLRDRAAEVRLRNGSGDPRQ